MKKEKSVKKAEIKAAIIEKLKGLAVPVILLAIILIGLIVIFTYENKTDEGQKVAIRGYDGDGSAIVLENDKLKMTFNSATTQFEILVKDTGKVWYSTPTDAANDALALTAEKDKLQSTLLMSYSIVSGLDTPFSSFGQSVKNGLYEVESGEDYIKVNYSMGNIEREYIIPLVATADEFKAMIEKMDKKNQNLMTEYYKKYDINKLGKKDNKEELLEKYPILADEVIYVLRETTTGKIRVNMESIFADIGYTMEDYERHKALSNAASTTDKPVFNVSMIYRLVDDELVVEVPLSSLEFGEDTPIYTITVLPYFGAGGANDEGYMLVPEGGGGLIHFNNGKVAQNSYYANLYGWDYALFQESVIHNTRAYFNAFGVARNDSSFICLLEEGAPYASVQADVAGKNHSYNFVNAVYSICSREKYDVGQIANSDIYVYIEDLPNETLTQKYRFVDSMEYADMATEYRDYLVERSNGLLTENNDTEAPVAFEIVGAVDKIRQILGVPVSRPLKLTTFDEAAEIIQELKNDGINNMSVKLTGWCNGGVQQEMLSKVKPISALGSKKDLQNLANTSKELGVDLYLDGITQNVYNSNLFDGFFSYRDAAKRISKERAQRFIYSDVTFAAREGTDPYYLLHTEVAHKMADNLVAAADTYGTGVSFKDLGMDLASDFYKKNYNSRQEVKEEQIEKLEGYIESDSKIMINMGNDYALPYSDFVTNMDLKGSEYTLLDECIPFYQMAIHGLVNYTGFPVNVCGDEVDEVLKAAEYGAGLQFSFMKETSFALQKTLYTEYYGSDYATWHDRMLEIYTRYNSELGHTFNQKMVNHDNITEEVSCTVYEDGTKVYVNYGYEDVNTDDGVIPAKDYKVIR